LTSRSYLFLAAQKKYTGFIPTGLNRHAYLELINAQVRYYMTQQQAVGQVADTYATGGWY
jgi:hypothetical protein